MLLSIKRLGKPSLKLVLTAKREAGKGSSKEAALARDEVTIEDFGFECDSDELTTAKLAELGKDSTYVISADAVASVCTIGDVKTCIAAQCQKADPEAPVLSHERQRIIFKGKVFSDSQTLAECNIKPGTVLHMVARAAPPAAAAAGEATTGADSNANGSSNASSGGVSTTTITSVDGGQLASAVGNLFQSFVGGNNAASSSSASSSSPSGVSSESSFVVSEDASVFDALDSEMTALTSSVEDLESRQAPAAGKAKQSSSDNATTTDATLSAFENVLRLSEQVTKLVTRSNAILSSVVTALRDQAKVTDAAARQALELRARQAASLAHRAGAVQVRCAQLLGMIRLGASADDVQPAQEPTAAVIKDGELAKTTTSTTVVTTKTVTTTTTVAHPDGVVPAVALRAATAPSSAPSAGGASEGSTPHITAQSVTHSVQDAAAPVMDMISSALQSFGGNNASSASSASSSEATGADGTTRQRAPSGITPSANTNTITQLMSSMSTPEGQAQLGNMITSFVGGGAAAGAAGAGANGGSPMDILSRALGGFSSANSDSSAPTATTDTAAAVQSKAVEATTAAATSSSSTSSSTTTAAAATAKATPLSLEPRPTRKIGKSKVTVAPLKPPKAFPKTGEFPGEWKDVMLADKVRMSDFD